MDLTTAKDWIEMLSKGATLVAAALAVYGINAWRRDFTGKRKIELAEESLRLFYQAADAVAHMRSPVAFDGESNHVVRGDQESETRFRARQAVAPLFKRYNEHSELFAALRTTRYKAMALLGPASEKPFKDLVSLVNEILVAAQSYVMAAQDYGFQSAEAEQLKVHRDGQREREELFWWHGAKDKVTPRMDSIVGSAEAFWRPHLPSTPLLARWRQTAIRTAKSMARAALRRRQTT
ncbi:hypothetical protein CURE108131_20955 [Cupriavidus respiraculi]|uniref:Uncharacterized protein n=1 Tax=Cupriavidus respiraculi TaxID=195930 RepID=A0ABN7YLL6_9BURK|nr:hypothetical protein [Cupriavidus respiraculi]CAG9173130.1 hypothetical protein LMG21510_02163 [Cupriavidus respiraculi]